MTVCRRMIRSVRHVYLNLQVNCFENTSKPMTNFFVASHICHRITRAIIAYRRPRNTFDMTNCTGSGNDPFEARRAKEML